MTESFASGQPTGGGDGSGGLGIAERSTKSVRDSKRQGYERDL
jgi:hypothetical protein